MLRALPFVLVLGSCAESQPPVPLPEELDAFYETMLDNADSLMEDDGEWLEDYGDAPFYGLALYTRLNAEEQTAERTALVARLRDYDIGVLEHANDDFPWALDNMEEVMMAALGLIEYMAAADDESPLEAVDAFIDTADTFVRGLGDYIPAAAGVGSFALTTYGPTSITGGLALIHLQYATYLSTGRSEDRLARGIALAARIEEVAWNGTHYDFTPDSDFFCIYPNSIMILVNARLYGLTRDRAYLDRAEATVDGIEPLRNEERGGFNSPYSAEYMGAETDDYSTLSSQNYLTLAFALVYEHTRDVRYLEEAFGVLEFVRTRLYDSEQEKILHHWMDGRIAQPEDPEYWCSGCTLHALYVLWYIRANLTA